MKLRVLNNSIRLRLTRKEVDDVCKSGLVRGRVSFSGGQTFAYVLESSPASVSVEAKFSNSALTVSVPGDEIRKWASSDQVSIAYNQAIAGDEDLTILVEKDFACLAPREGVDESDMFPHPLEGQETC